jgi:hypothetical protein
MPTMALVSATQSPAFLYMVLSLAGDIRHASDIEPIYYQLETRSCFLKENSGTAISSVAK